MKQEVLLLSASAAVVLLLLPADTRPLRATLATSATPMTISQGNSAPRTGLVARDWSGLLLQLRFLSPVFNSSSDVLNALVITGGTPTILEGNARRLRIAVCTAHEHVCLRTYVQGTGLIPTVCRNLLHCGAVQGWIGLDADCMAGRWWNSSVVSSVSHQTSSQGPSALLT